MVTRPDDPGFLTKAHFGQRLPPEILEGVGLQLWPHSKHLAGVGTLLLWGSDNHSTSTFLARRCHSGNEIAGGLLFALHLGWPEYPYSFRGLTIHVSSQSKHFATFDVSANVSGVPLTQVAFRA
jgi:hypothetical protein